MLPLPQFGQVSFAPRSIALRTERWPVDGVPPNPGAWLTTTAQRKGIDRLRREVKREELHKLLAGWEALMRTDTPEPLGAIDDDRLRLIFTCCHPALAMEGRVALTLRMVGGLTVPEIARAFLTQEAAMSTPKVRSYDMKFEIVVIPVSDVDRAKEFYGRLGWRLDAEFASGDDFRIMQFTPPGSGCSIIFGKNVTAAAPGAAQGLYLIVSDIAAARDELRGRGVDVSEVFHSDGAYAGTDEPYLFGRRRTSGPDPQRGSYRSFASFRDPDGNGWLLQEVTTRLPGRIDSGATLKSAIAAR